MRRRWLSGKALGTRGTPLCAPPGVRRPSRGPSLATHRPARRRGRAPFAGSGRRTRRADLRPVPCASWRPPYRAGSWRSGPGSAATRRPLEVAAYGCLETLVVVGDHQLHPLKPSPFEGAEQLLIARLAFGVGHLHPEDLPQTVRLAHPRDDYDPLAH